MDKLLFLLAFATMTPLWADELSYNRDIRPILSEHCFACHGPDDDAREAELRLDARAIALERGAIVPGSLDESELVQRIMTEDPDARMPPAGHRPLSSDQRETLRRWIQEGAKYQVHWAFVLPQRTPVPAVPEAYASWVRNPIDAFVLRQLLDRELKPAPEASKYALIRRLYLDLIGLPPTPRAVAAFVSDDSDRAYEKVVDELLASEHFGEHWARAWLDLARYADTKGYEKDNHRDIWRYRDWVIEALNQDMPYAQFTIEQLAGDLLPNPSTSQLIATAFHRNTMTNDEGGTDNEEFRTIAVKDRVDTTIQVWMGLTMGCAKCHSHKYDPISQRDYYRFYAYFNQTEDADRGDDAPRIKTPTEEQARGLAKLTGQLEAAKEDAASRDESDPRRDAAEQRVKDLEKQLANAEQASTSTPVMRELAKDKRRQTHIHVRGNFLDQGEEVEPAVLSSFAVNSATDPRNRLGVARWLLHEENPLTARVAVNRVWARILGVGFVETEEDFGTQGAYPSHPELLDWLAINFREELGWSHKQLCKFIVMSSTYRQSAVVSDAAQAVDPRNRWFSRGVRFRLTAETVRDQALAAAGLLSPRIGGPSVMPPQPEGIWKATYSKLRWQTATGSDRYRRGIYTYWRRTSPYPSMLTFDAGSREVCLIRRIRTNIPLQALVTMNDPVFVEASGALAKRVLDSGLSDDDTRLVSVFQRVLVRPPDEPELERLRQALAEARHEFQTHPKLAEELVHSANLESSEDSVTLAAWTVVANVLLNLDETLMRN